MPTQFLATEQYHARYHNRSIAMLTLQWDMTSPSAQWYELEVSPPPLSPVVHVTSPMNLTLEFGVEYITALTAVNCVGKSSSVSIIHQLGKMVDYTT